MEKFLLLTLFLAGRAMQALCRHSHRPMTGEEITTMLKHYDVVPDVIDESKDLDQLIVVYNYTIFLDYGTKLKAQQIENKPTRLFWPVFGKELYTLIFIEPDHPLKGREKEHEFVHWLVGNIPGTQVDKGDEIADYIGYRSFYEDKKPHRLVYLVYKQPDSDPIAFNETKLITAQVVERGHWYNFTARKFAEKYDLSGPVAVNLGFIECKRMWHGRKYKVFKNESTVTDVDLFSDVVEDEGFSTAKPSPKNTSRKPVGAKRGRQKT